MINRILESDLVLAVVDGRLSVKGPKSLLSELAPIIKHWKPELLRIAGGDTIGDVGQCDQCAADLIGLPVAFDRFINRVCPACGKWHRCLPPDWTKDAEKADTLNDAVEHQQLQERIELRWQASERTIKMAASLAGLTTESITTSKTE